MTWDIYAAAIGPEKPGDCLADDLTGSGKWASNRYHKGAHPFDAASHQAKMWLGGWKNIPTGKPIAADRGMPDDYPDGPPGGHSARSWVAISELLAADYDARVSGATLADVLGPEFFADLRELQRIGADRVVFGFG